MPPKETKADLWRKVSDALKEMDKAALDHGEGSPEHLAAVKDRDDAIRAWKAK